MHLVPAMCLSSIPMFVDGNLRFFSLMSCGTPSFTTCHVSADGRPSSW